MWTSTMDLDLKKVLLTQFIGRFYRGIYFSSYSPLQVQNLPRQSLPESSWVRVRNRLAGVSGSDLHQLYHSDDMRVATTAGPDRKRYYPGHEVVGEVIEIGDDVRHLNVGDRVTLQYGPNCYTADIQPPCRACSTGNYFLCEQGALLAAPPLGGGWSEEMLLHEQQLFRVPETLTDEQAVMLEPAAIAAHAVLHNPPQAGDRVLIIGAGTVGLLTQQIVNTLAPQVEVSVLARYPFQVEQATRQGADHIIYAHNAYVDVQRATQARLYHGLLGNQTLLGGYDVIYDTVGQRKTLHHALRWTRAGGSIVLVGLQPRMMHIDLTPLWSQEISLLGSTAHGAERWPIHSKEQRTTYEVVTELIEHGRISPEQLITHHFALTNYKHALLTASQKAESRAVKVVFDYSLLPASVVPNVRASAPKIRRPTTINFGVPTSSQIDDVPVSRTSSTNIPTPQHRSVPLRTPLITNQPRTSGTRYTRPAISQDEDEVTATALPALHRRMTRDNRLSADTPVTPATPPPSAQPSLEFAALPRPQELTRETRQTPAPSSGDENKEPAASMNAEEEVDEQTQRISRDEIKKYLSNALLASTPESSADDPEPAEPAQSITTNEQPSSTEVSTPATDLTQDADNEKGSPTPDAEPVEETAPALPVLEANEKSESSSHLEHTESKDVSSAEAEHNEDVNEGVSEDLAHEDSHEETAHEQSETEDDDEVLNSSPNEELSYESYDESPNEELTYESYDERAHEDLRYESYDAIPNEELSYESYDETPNEDVSAELASTHNNDSDRTEDDNNYAINAEPQSLHNVEVPAVARTSHGARSRNRKRKGGR